MFSSKGFNSQSWRRAEGRILVMEQIKIFRLKDKMGKRALRSKRVWYTNLSAD